MSYRLIVKFEDGKGPQADALRQLVRGFDQDAITEGNILRLTDPYTGDSFTVDCRDPSQTVTLEVPHSSSVRSLSVAYALARALADKFGGTMEDPQLNGPASFDLAREEWRKYGSTEPLTKAFGGKIPNDLKLKIRQRRGLLRQEIEIHGEELEITRKSTFKTFHYYIPIASLGTIRQSTVPNPRWSIIAIAGFIIFFFDTMVPGASPIDGWGVITGFIILMLSLLLMYSRNKRQLIVLPGRGGNLVLESASPSKFEVQEFLSSIDRVRFALLRPHKLDSPAKTTDDTERMGVV